VSLFRSDPEEVHRQDDPAAQALITAEVAWGGTAYPVSCSTAILPIDAFSWGDDTPPQRMGTVDLKAAGAITTGAGGQASKRAFYEAKGETGSVAEAAAAANREGAAASTEAALKWPTHAYVVQFASPEEATVALRELWARVVQAQGGVKEATLRLHYGGQLGNYVSSIIEKGKVAVSI
jgi:hypothetical protein